MGSSSSKNSRRGGGSGTPPTRRVRRASCCFPFSVTTRTPSASPAHPCSRARDEIPTNSTVASSGAVSFGDVEVDCKSDGTAPGDCQKHVSSPIEQGVLVSPQVSSHARDSGVDSISPSSHPNLRSGSPSRLRSRLGLGPDGNRCRLNRAASLGSSMTHSVLSDSLPVANGVDAPALAELGRSPDVSTCLDPPPPAEASHSCHARDHDDAAGRRTWGNISEAANLQTSRPCPRVGPQEPLEGNVRFSRTLSVGRLRDRVLRRSLCPDGTFFPSLLDDSSLWSTARTNTRHAMGGTRRPSSFSHRNSELQPESASDQSPGSSNFPDGDDRPSPETSQPTEASSRDLSERRSAFLERTRRIRSQVRALQRLGSRFENLSGHDRSCILSGQHRSGHCTCRTANRSTNSDDETSTRSSISRIVMLAEALFEVLDEIHQHSVVLSSRSSFSPIGSVPAPEKVVDGLPVKPYSKPVKNQNEEPAQCYICLVEYEDGDRLRLLPCNHEFHLSCIDKWLKEIHRVCPLCRGDVCRSDGAITGKS